MLGAHGKPASLRKPRPISGIVFASWISGSIVSAYLLYYLGDEGLRQLVGYAHLGFGLTAPLVLALHVRLARIYRRRQRERNSMVWYGENCISCLWLLQFLVWIVVVSGIFVAVEKDIDWIQPPITVSCRGWSSSITFDRVLEIANLQPVGEINDWSDISRLDVRPGKGVIKIRSKISGRFKSIANWAVLSSAYRRSDIIEAIHEGTFFHDAARLGIFLPSANNLITAAKIGVRNNVSMDKSQRAGVSIAAA